MTSFPFIEGNEKNCNFRKHISGRLFDEANEASSACNLVIIFNQYL